MSFLDELKAQKGLGKKPVPPPKVEKEPELPKPKKRLYKCSKCGEDASIYDHGKWLKNNETCDECLKEKKPEPKPVKPVAGEKTRESWLMEAFELIADRLFDQKVPYCRISIGFPAGSRKRQINKTLGQYWPKASASDGVPQIFISPSSGASSDPVYMLAVLVHEMVHACTEGAGHGPEFRRLAIKVGLQPPMRSTTASAKLKKSLRKIADELGQFPHGTIDPTSRPGKKGKLKGYECKGYEDSCGFKLYTTTKWIDYSGGDIDCPNPRCQSGYPMKYVPPKS